MLPAEDVPVVAPTRNLAEVWEQMATTGSTWVAVKNGAEFSGLITIEDITEVFQVMGATMTKTGQPAPGLIAAEPASTPNERSADA